MSIDALLKTNVNDHVEKKNGLSYLSWAWAWAEALKADPKATFKVEMFGDKCFMDVNGTAMVWVTVTIFDKPMTCQLPVMDSSNKAIPIQGYTAVNKYGKEYRVECDSFAVNTAIMRCMTKALSLHGLGLYIYAGEDIPEQAPVPKIKPMPDVELPEEEKVELQEIAELLKELVTTDLAHAKEVVSTANLDEAQKVYLWSLLDSKTRSALKKKD